MREEPPPFEAICFDDFDDAQGYPQPADLKPILVAAADGTGKIAEATKTILGKNQRMSQISGLHRLAVVWQPETALRWSLIEPRQFQLHVFSGHSGVTLRYYPEFQQTWAAYGTTRSADKLRPASYALWATDGERYRRTGAGTFEIRWQDGRLVMTRGNAILLTAPLEGMPSDVLVEGNATVRGLAVLRSGAVSLPPKRVRPAALRSLRSADLTWTTQLKEKVAFNRLPDGRVEIAAEENAGEGQGSAPICPPGLHEIICEVDDPQPGTGVFLGNDQKQQVCRVGFFRDQATGRTTFGALPPWANEVDRGSDFNREPTRFVGSRCWLRLVLGAGLLQYWISADGSDWNWPAAPSMQCTGPCPHFGIYVLPGGRKRSIRLRSVEIRRFTALPGLAPEAICRRVPNWQPIDQVDSWEKRMAQSLPSDVSLDVWRRASILRTLAGKQGHDVGQRLLTRLLTEAVDQEGPLPPKLDLLQEGAMLHDTAEWNAGWKFVEVYGCLGRGLAYQGDPSPFSAITSRLIELPCWSHQPTQIYAEELLRHELALAVAQRRWQPVADLCRQLRFWERPLRLEGKESRWGGEAEHVIRWAEGQVGQRLRPRVEDPAAGAAIDWRHPLIDNLNREGYNLLTEVQAALESGEYREACRVITMSINPASPGMVPDRDDDRLSFGYPVAIELAMQRTPALRRAMVEEFEAIGRLRVQRAMADDNATAVEAATVQFSSTAGATAAHEWLGDRALAGGQFSHAADHYEIAMRTTPDPEHAGLQAKLRLAAAYDGREVGDALTTAIQFGELRVSAADFEKMVQEARQRYLAERPRGGSAGATAVELICPPPGSYETRAWGAVEGRRNQRPNWMPDRGLDWAARLTTAVADERQMIVNNQFELSAFEMPSGKRLWSSQPVKEQEQRWPTVPMCPVVTATRVFARRIIEERPELVCLDRSDGKLVWDSRPADYLASDPLLVGRDLLLLVASGAQSGKLLLSLGCWDAASGQLRRQTPLTEFFDGWEGKVPCAAVQHGERIIATVAGCVLACDVAGRMHWIRRQVWIRPPGPDYYRAKSWLQQCHEAPWVANGRVYATQPGVFGLECLDVSTGQLWWRCSIPGLIKPLSIVEKRLIVQTTSGLVALDVASGKILWHRDLEGLLEGRLAGAPGGILCVRRQQNADLERPCQPVLVWLDPTDGRTAYEVVLNTPPQKDLRLGPMIAYGTRQWIFLQTSDRWASREIFELVLGEDKK